MASPPLLWNAAQDNFQFTTKIDLPITLTKRTLLSIISQIFDPLGLIGPVVIKSKIILQKLWLLKLDWDDIIPSNYHKDIKQFFEDFRSIRIINVPRKVMVPQYSSLELHGFTDASESSYGVCFYIKTINKRNEVLTTLLCSKSKVAPLKVISIPRLELCGAVLLSKLFKKVTNSLKITFDRVYL